jgi:hypothetical protein
LHDVPMGCILHRPFRTNGRVTADGTGG